MEFNSCILLYSKYSSTSKKLMEYIKTSGVDFTNVIGLQPLCVDNEEVRKRITKNTQLSISSVPCILLIYQDGGIEKYEGISVFNWCEDIIKQFTPTSTPVTQDLNRNNLSDIGRQEQQKWSQQRSMKDIQPKDYEENPKDVEKRKRDLENRRLFEENKRKYEEQQMKESIENETYTEAEAEKEFKRVPIDKSESNFSKKVTSLEDLPSEDEEEPDRYKNRKPVGRIRTDKGNYEGSEELFKGSPPSTRKPISKSALKNSNTTLQKNSDIMNKAKELAKGREPELPPPGHPIR